MKPGRAVGKRHGFVQIAGVDKKYAFVLIIARLTSPA